MTSAESGFEVLYSFDAFYEDASPEWTVEDYEYLFNINDCRSDIDCSGTVDSDDLNQVLLNFRGSGTTPPFFPPNVDATGGVDSDDLNAVLADFGDPCGCDGGEPMELLGGSIPPVLAELGWEDLGEYTTWVQSLNESERWEHIADLLEAAEKLGYFN